MTHILLKPNLLKVVISSLFLLAAGLSFNLASADIDGTNCDIQLGDSACAYDIELDGKAGEEFDYTITNSGATYSGLDLTMTGTITITADGTFSYKAKSGASAGWDTFRDLRANLPFTFGLGMNNYGKNTITIKDDSGRVVDSSSVQTKCAAGLVWTHFSETNGQAEYITSAGALQTYGQYKCAPKVDGATAFAPGKPEQIIYGKGKPNKVFDDANYGTVAGYCAPGGKWQQITEVTKIAGGTTRTDTKYQCAPNVESVTPSQTSLAISQTNPGYAAGSSGSCDTPISTNTPEDQLEDMSCFGLMTVNAPTDRFYALHNKDTVEWTGRKDDFVTNLRSYSFTNKAFVSSNNGIYTSGGGGTSGSFGPYYPLSVRLSYTKPVTYELRLPVGPLTNLGEAAQAGLLGTTVLTRITATPKVTKTGSCGAFRSGNCDTYTWTFSSAPVTGTGSTGTGSTGTGSTPVTTTPINPNTGALPAGCASALPNSAYALANCQGTPFVPTTQSSGAAANTTITSSLAVGSSGAEVETLQKFLISQNYLASDSVTGYYGPATVAAVQKYQCAKGIVCDGAPDTTGYGAVGPSTRAAINAGGSTGAATQSNSDISALIQSLLKQVQALMVQLEALKAKGL